MDRMNLVKRLSFFRDGALFFSFIRGEASEVDVQAGDISSDGLLFYEYPTGVAPKLMHADDPRIPPLRALIPADTDRGWLLAGCLSASVRARCLLTAVLHRDTVSQR